MNNEVMVGKATININNLGIGVANRIRNIFGHINDQDWEDIAQTASAYAVYLIQKHKAEGFVPETPYKLYFSYALKRGFQTWWKMQGTNQERVDKGKPINVSFSDLIPEDEPDFDILEREFGVVDRYDFFKFEDIKTVFKEQRKRQGGTRAELAAERDARLVWLLYLGYNNQEISEILNMSYETVKSYRKRIKSALREMVNS